MLTVCRCTLFIIVLPISVGIRSLPVDQVSKLAVMASNLRLSVFNYHAPACEELQHPDLSTFDSNEFWRYLCCFRMVKSNLVIERQRIREVYRQFCNRPEDGLVCFWDLPDGGVKTIPLSDFIAWGSTTTELCGIKRKEEVLAFTM
jgi:hypothetical protein